jgi:hypothetical protein
MSAAGPGNPDFAAAVQSVERLSPELVRQADDVVRLYETTSARKVARLRWIQTAFFAGALGLLAVGFWMARRSIVKPLRRPLQRNSPPNPNAPGGKPIFATTPFYVIINKIWSFLSDAIKPIVELQVKLAKIGPRANHNGKTSNIHPWG